MNLSLWAIVLSSFCAAVILMRCVCILNNMDHRQRGTNFAHFAAFGLSYCLLAAGAMSAMFQIWEGRADWGGWAFLLASAGLIVFDRRRGRRICEAENKCRAGRADQLGGGS